MKHTILSLVLVCLWCCTGKLTAQTIDSSNVNYYQEFVRLHTEGGDDSTKYAMLYLCYQENVAVLDTAEMNSPEYVQAKTILREIYPALQNGAAYNSMHNSNENALLFAQAFLDLPLMKQFENDSFVRNEGFTNLAYFAAAGTYNSGDYERAIKYFRVYLNTGEQKNRQAVYTFMAKACMNVKNYTLAMEVFSEADAAYPNDFQLLSFAINSCIEIDDKVNLHKFLNKALAIKPDDNTLHNIEGQLYEDLHEYQKALNVYNQLLQTNPKSLTINRHIALNYYNLGVVFFNKATIEANEDVAIRYSHQAKEYFSAAAETLENIVANDPTSVRYMQALATVYSCMGDTTNLESVNTKLTMMGGSNVTRNVTPMLMSYSGATVSDNSQSVSVSTSNYPRFSAFAKDYVETRLIKWREKDPYETLAEYQVRVTEETYKLKLEELKKNAQGEYIKVYAPRLRYTDMRLKPYDAENGVFLVDSKYGELIVPVPRENNKARVFERGWSGMEFKDPEYGIKNDELVLTGLTFLTPTGDTYRYEGDKNLKYQETVVDVSFDHLSNQFFAQNSSTSNSRIQHKTVTVGTVISDVDKNIPDVEIENSKTFAVIIANENYSMVSEVPMALNDGEIFSQYCKKTLGLPEDNVRLYKNASYGVMIRAMRDIKNIASAFSGDIQVIFYYAGHGIPNEATKDAFLLPIDADGMQTEGCYSLNRLYGELGALDAKSVVVFLDACFSGANRDGGMLASARGVALKVKPEEPKGNMVIFSAASDDETAFPYKEKGHGLFTYYLLKKLQESKGDVTLQELGNYITTNVKQQSVVVNHKLQTPTVNPSTGIVGWEELKLNGQELNNN